MDAQTTLTLGSEAVRFTPDGKVAVVDAIKAVSAADRPEDVWDLVKSQHPEILFFCHEYHFHHENATPVVDSQGWESLQDILFDLLLEGKIDF